MAAGADGDGGLRLLPTMLGECAGSGREEGARAGRATPRAEPRSWYLVPTGFFLVAN